MISPDTLNETLLPSPNLPIILTLCHVANLIECLAMFGFIKGLQVLCIVTGPYADCFLLLGGFPILLHLILDVSGFGRGKD